MIPKVYATMNMFITGILIAEMTSVFHFFSFLVGGESGMIITFLIAIAMNGFAYWNADKVVLQIYGAKEVNRVSAPAYYGIVEQLPINPEPPMPPVYIVKNDQPNAFATGRNPENAAVAATTGLLAHFSSEEMAGVMAHVLAHVKNRDMLIRAKPRNGSPVHRKPTSRTLDRWFVLHPSEDGGRDFVLNTTSTVGMIGSFCLSHRCFRPKSAPWH